jgi:hypothetical protein
MLRARIPFTGRTYASEKARSVDSLNPDPNSTIAHAPRVTYPRTLEMVWKNWTET